MNIMKTLKMATVAAMLLLVGNVSAREPRKELTDKRIAVSNWVAGKKYMVPLRVEA
jgi:hypothetical protein